MNKKSVSVIIVSYNNRDVIEDCLNSIRDNNDIDNDLEVIVVEQSDTDLLYQDLENRYPDISVIRAENKGFGAGNNAGAKAANGEILFFLNPDTVIKEPLFAFITEQFRKDRQLGLMGFRLLSADGRNISYNMRFPFGLKAKLTYVLCLKFDRFVSSQMYIEGADLIFRREAFEKAGGFDENIFMYGEEADLCYRVQKEGYTIRYFPEKSILHLQGQCTSDKYPTVFRKQLQSYIYICNKHGFNAQKWMKRELRYQKFRAKLMSTLGQKDGADLSRELVKVLEELSVSRG